MSHDDSVSDGYPVEINKRDKGIRVERFLTAAVPFAGGSLVEMLTWVTPPLEKKREQWFNGLNSRVRRLEADHEAFRPERLVENPHFAAAVVQAHQGVLATDQVVKMRALRNAVLNSADTTDADADARQMFFGYINDISAGHITLLDFLNGPSQWYLKRGIDTTSIGTNPQLYRALSLVLPQFAQSTNVYGVMINDLKTRGFLSTVPGGAYAVMIIGETYTLTDDQYRARDASILSQWGKDFLSFITHSPLPDDEDIFSGDPKI